MLTGPIVSWNAAFIGVGLWHRLLSALSQPKKQVVLSNYRKLYSFLLAVSAQGIVYTPQICRVFIISNSS